jgi:multidrug efflux pump subunit AcrA (membrane-fusion protein)
MGHARHGQQGQLLSLSFTRGLRFAAVVLAASAAFVRAQGVREHTRPGPDRPAAITPSQANELTLTLTEAAVRPVQVWVRAAGVPGPDGRTLKTLLPMSEGALVKAGQRVRAFPPESRSSMYQARVTLVQPHPTGVAATVTLAGPGLQGASRYVLEIVTAAVESLCVPNEAIIENGSARVVYVQRQEGRYEPREIQTGVQGELYTQVLEGLKPGEQVVTFGSFFIDADYKLKGS